MCGIAGLIASSARADECLSRVSAMTVAIQHRGPDDVGVETLHETDPVVIFGHHRLAIIDLSPAGHEPMHDPDTDNWIIFNGEIYNYRELRQQLKQQGQVFRTQTDTEVILKAYAYWGSSCARHLRGIFSFGIWSRSSRRLFLARDHLGVKPLYYWFDGSTLIFASEGRAFLESRLVHGSLRLNRLHSFLTYGSVQEPYTLLQGISSLPPGST